MAIRIKQIKNRLSKISKEIIEGEGNYNVVKLTLVVNDPTNNSRLAKNEMHRIRVKIDQLKNEKKKLTEEAINW